MSPSREDSETGSEQYRTLTCTQTKTIYMQEKVQFRLVTQSFSTESAIVYPFVGIILV